MKQSVIEDFIEELKKSPDEVMTFVRVRLSCTDIELKLLRANPLKPFESQWDSARKHEDEVYLFPLHVEDKGVVVK